ncbi:MAG TPA: metal ABC transporter substrate-binding protein [Coleofasciculaceae cyanobacterium]|jgi:zinc/manganese transport system substrate-binding protein
MFQSVFPSIYSSRHPGVLATAAKILALVVLSLLLFVMSPAAMAAGGKIKVVTTSQDLAAIARSVGGDKVEVFAMGKGYQNPHFVPPRPSFILKLKDADLLVSSGLDLEPWLQPLVENSRNANVFTNASGYVDASVGVPLLQVPSNRVTRQMGDLHGFGNPHYWLDPVNAKYISANIVNGLKRVDPQDAAYFDQQRQIFLKQLSGKITGWMNAAKPLQGLKVIAYHNSWPYFEKRFGLNIVALLEPKPGIPPSPKHLQEVIRKAKEENVKVIIMDPYFPRSGPDLVAKATGAKVVVLPSSVGAFPDVTDYFSLFDRQIALLKQAL